MISDAMNARKPIQTRAVIQSSRRRTEAHAGSRYRLSPVNVMAMGNPKIKKGRGYFPYLLSMSLIILPYAGLVMSIPMNTPRIVVIANPLRAPKPM